MADAWDGRPENPERDGFHWLADGPGIRTAFWRATRFADIPPPYWMVNGRNLSASAAARDYRYLRPCLTPDELRAALAAARREGAEADARVDAAQAVNAHAAHYPTDVFPELRPENWRHSQPTTDAISASAIRHTCRVLADAVRALPIEEPQR